MARAVGAVGARGPRSPIALHGNAIETRRGGARPRHRYGRWEVASHRAWRGGGGGGSGASAAGWPGRRAAGWDGGTRATRGGGDELPRGKLGVPALPMRDVRAAAAAERRGAGIDGRWRGGPRDSHDRQAIDYFPDAIFPTAHRHDRNHTSHSAHSHTVTHVRARSEEPVSSPSRSDHARNIHGTHVE